MSGAAAGLLPIAMERGVELRVDAPPRIRTARGDRRRVEQILTNLAGNALKFGRADGHGVVELAASFEGAAAVLVVRDDGAGIEPDDRARIFERFYRMAGHERVTGTGLGLPIARELARAMGGDLDVASLPGTGSAFVLAMPTPAAAVDEGAAAHLHAPRPGRRDGPARDHRCRARRTRRPACRRRCPERRGGRPGRRPDTASAAGPWPPPTPVPEALATAPRRRPVIHESAGARVHWWISPLTVA